ncbi:MAG: hypothetical protein L0H64_16540 [Pseudonocardia sp.]|nr:hypothetical protein [Pseudonocardia sp.]
MRAPAVRVRDAAVADLATTAELYLENLSVGLFPRLGRPFVARWHRAFVDSSHAVALVSIETLPDARERITGFVIGATDRRTFREELLTQHRGSLLMHGVRALVVRPRRSPPSRSLRRRVAMAAAGR